MCLDQTKNPHDVERSYPETHPLFFRCMNQIHLWHQGAVPSKAWKQQELRTSSLLFTSLECVRYREQESCPENWMRCLTDKFVMSPAKELEGRAWHRCVCVCDKHSSEYTNPSLICIVHSYLGVEGVQSKVQIK